MADGGRYRKRRYATYEAASDGSIVRAEHQPHYQTLDYNPLNGGIPRWFEPIEPEIGASQSMVAILRFCHDLFGQFAAAAAWHRATE